MTRTPLLGGHRNHEISSGCKPRIFVEKLLWSPGAREELIKRIFLKLTSEIKHCGSQVFQRLSADGKRFFRF
jgi:hypothetical protein